MRTLHITYPYLICVLTLGIGCLQPSKTNAQIRRIIIEPSETFQTIDNFTASDAWSGNFVGKYWGESQKGQVAEWLFSRETDVAGNPKGIGLSMWRVNLGAGTWEQEGADIQPLQRRAESYMTVDGKHYDWGKCAGQRYFMERAAEYGCNNFLLFSNSPLVQYTLNGKGWADTNNAANIDPGAYGQYADYLAEVAGHFVEKGWNISYISPINEPQVQWDTPRQEGSPWKMSEMKKMYAALDEAISRRPLLSGVKILVGEAGSGNVLYREEENLIGRFGREEAPHKLIKAFFDADSPWFLGDLQSVPRLIGGHSYNNHTRNALMKDVRTLVGEECAKYGVAYHQTEWCLLPNFSPPMDGFTDDWQKGNRGDIQVALLMGRLIYSDLVHSGAEAWGYWKGMELKGDHALIALYADEGNIFNGGTVSANKLLWALGNYSFFIRPGYERISLANAEDLDGLVASAYISPDRSRIVIVFVNSGFGEDEIEISLPKNFRKMVENTSVYITDHRNDLSCWDSSGGLQGSYRIKPRSLTTMVLKLKTR